MIEAFEIGVSLALRDGVSESIAQAQRNVEALERAVNANGLTVQTLRDAGARAVSLVVGEPRKEKAQKPLVPSVEREGQVAGFYRTDLVQPGSVPEMAGEPSVIERQKETQIITYPVKPNLQLAEVASPNKQNVNFVVPESDPVAVPRNLQPALSLLPGRPANIVTVPAPAAPGRASVNDQAPVSPTLAEVLPPEHSAQSASLVQNSFTTMNMTLLEQFGGQSEDDSLPAPVVPDYQAPPGQTEPVRLGEIWPGVAPVHKDAVAAPLSARMSVSSHPEQVAPRVAERQPANADVHGTWFSSETVLHTELTASMQRAEATPKSMAPQTRTADQGYMTGDVYLDGTLVGRWISRFLKREAERAGSGPTGFDAKRSRLLPGVTVGG